LDTGPFLKAAAICSDVIEGKDGVLSLIRVIDRLTVSTHTSSGEVQVPVARYPVKIVLMFVSGRARGTYDVAVKIEQPDGATKECWSGGIFLEGEDRGANIIIAADVEFPTQGLYWFDLYFDGAGLTRMPFRVIHQRAGAGRASP
jgi:hypothetical protein